MRFFALQLAFVMLCAWTTTAQTTKKPAKTVAVNCNVKNACYPWQTVGPKCGRGNKMNLRFMSDLAPENRKIVNNDTLSYVTYAFCPIVDELQAFNLSSSLKLAGVYNTLQVPADDVSGTAAPVPTPTLSKSLEISYLSVFGLGDDDATDPYRLFFPNATTSFGQVGIVFNTSDCAEGEVGIVNFLVLNITLSGGLYKYYSDFRMPVGSGFSPTCDAFSVCLLDPTLKCFGEKGKTNCGQCVSAATDLSNTPLQIWTSYYGTDAYGRQMRSGSSNPLNFRAFSGGGVYASMRRSYNNIRDGNTVDESDLTPDAGT